MREKKFRAFYKGKMYIVYCLQFSDDFDEPLNYEAAQIRYNGEWLWIEKDVYVLSEYTGLKDCKRTEEFPDGQDIYEGDIVTHPSYSEGSLTVQWDTFGWALFWLMCNEMWLDEECEIIGNIHDNPELLK